MSRLSEDDFITHVELAAKANIVWPEGGEPKVYMGPIVLRGPDPILSPTQAYRRFAARVQQLIDGKT